MKRTAASIILLLLVHFTVSAQRDYASLVNPFIGTGGHGHTYPGAVMPYGMAQISPDTRMADWDGSSGYHYSDSVIYGFSQTHLSGTGIPDYCDVLMMPFTGDVKWKNTDYRSTFSHKNEKASPGYYEVLLDKGNIKAQLTASYRSGMHQYTYPVEKGAVLIDLKHRDEVLEAFIEKVSPTELRGLRRSRSWAQNQYVYFDIQFDQPISEYIISQDGSVINAAFAQGKDIKVAIRFNLPANKVLKAKVGISGVSLEGARNNLLTEIPGWDFAALQTAAKEAWNKELGKIDVSGGTADQQTIFYTALYHTMLAPNIYTDIDGKFRGTDLRIHSANGFTNYTVFSLWDTYRALHPLMSIINQKRTGDWINTFLAEYKYAGMLPVWELSGNETFCMIGYHSVPVITDAYQKGIRNFDAKLALEGMKSYAESKRFGLPYYMSHGYLGNDVEHESVSKTMEYAYDDWCIAQFAKMIGVDSVYRKYIQRAQYYKNVFDKQTMHPRGKIQSMWQTPFDPREINNFFTEGNSWQYSFAAPQDISGLIKLYGGREAFGEKLNELFTTSSSMTGRDQSDVTGLIGQYAHGNEPSHHMAYLFNYAGQPDKTEELVHRICAEFYRNDPDGLIGNEDCGQMSAWYVLSAMGFYPVCPAHGDYVIGTPVFDNIAIHLEDGKTFMINANRKNNNSFYVSSSTLNNQPFTHSWIAHTDIMKGSTLRFNLSDKPGVVWGKKEADLPSTSITDNTIVPVPYFDSVPIRFTRSTSVSLRTIDPSSKIFYSVKEASSQLESKTSVYKKPFSVTNTSTVTAYAENNGKRSPLVQQEFYKLPTDRSISVLSKVNPMYTAGGPESLIDGVEGSVNWRTGNWQGYFNQDFEAIIDLQKVQSVTYVGIHVLQDMPAWIMFPKGIIVYSGNDGQSFTEAGKTEAPFDDDQSQKIKEMRVPVNLESRYIKIKVLNGGKLLAYHESAGSPSHLFIDEIIVK